MLTNLKQAILFFIILSFETSYSQSKHESVLDKVEHYKNLFEYQRKQSDRILEMHEKLIVTIGEQTQSSIQRNHIEAKDKKYL